MIFLYDLSSSNAIRAYELKCDAVSHSKLLDLTSKIDECLISFKLDQFYSQPSFHVTVFSLSGDQEEYLNAYISDIQCAINELVISKELYSRCLVDEIIMKAGCKEIKFALL